MGPLGFNLETLGKVTLGELSDLYSGYIWRVERQRQEIASQTMILGRAWGMEIDMEDILGRQIYPALRSVTPISGDEALIDSRPFNSKISEIEEVKAMFKELGLEEG